MTGHSAWRGFDSRAQRTSKSGAPSTHLTPSRSSSVIVGGMRNEPCVTDCVFSGTVALRTNMASVSSRMPEIIFGRNFSPSDSVSRCTARATSSAVAPRFTSMLPWATALGSSRCETAERKE